MSFEEMRKNVEKKGKNRGGGEGGRWEETSFYDDDKLIF